MGFTHHSQVAGDLIFASHHGGQLQHGHGFGLQAPAPGVGTASANGSIGLGLSDLGFVADTSSSQHEVTAFSLDPIIDVAGLGLINPSLSTPSLSPDPYDLRPPSSNYGIAPADLHTQPISPLTPTDSIPALQHQLSQLQYDPLQPHPAASLIPSSSMPAPTVSRRMTPNAHLRSASQPPAMFNASLNSLRRDQFNVTPRTPHRAITRDDAMQHYPQRAPNPFPLPFLDLHYYVTGEVSPAAAGRPPDSQGQLYPYHP
jgi:hypothetical protein